MMKMQPTFTLLWAPDEHSTADSVRAGRDAVYAAVFRDVTGSAHVFRPGAASGGWVVGYDAGATGGRIDRHRGNE